MNLYFIKDDVAGAFKFFGEFVNDGVASRSFRMACAEPGVPYKDLCLFKLAEYDIHEGTLNPCSTFIERGVKLEV